MDAVLAERRDSVVWLTLNRPEQMNALSSEVITALSSEIATAARAERDRVIVITGAGAAFCAGADLAEAEHRTASAAAFREWLIDWRNAFRSLERCPKPVLAALNGATLAGGLELALACDVMIASDRAVIGDVHARYGLVPGGGGSQRLPEAIGTRRARWLMYTASVLKPEQALDWGLVQHVAPHEQFTEAVQEIALAMARRSRDSLAFMKRMSTPDAVQDRDLDLELEGAAHVIMGADAREGLRAFLAKRDPAFEGAPQP